MSGQIDRVHVMVLGKRQDVLSPRHLRRGQTVDQNQGRTLSGLDVPDPHAPDYSVF